MGYISETKLFGWLPLDLTLHFVIGFLITLFLLKKKWKLSHIFYVLFTLAALKELNDYFFHWRSSWWEYISDFLVTFAYLGMVATIRKIKKILTEKEDESPPPLNEG